MKNKYSLAAKIGLLIGVIGVLFVAGKLLLSSYAATPTAAFEAEAGTLAGGATVTDATASAGKSFRFTSPVTGTVLWSGNTDACGAGGYLAPGSITGGASAPACSPYSSVQQLGGQGVNAIVAGHTRSSREKTALKITIPANKQREQPSSKFKWNPTSNGSVDHWYGWSLYYDTDWNLGGGITKEISGSYWHNPIAFRTQNPNGSMNLSGDMNMNNENGQPYATFSTPHMVLRRNTKMHEEGFYRDGLGLDKMDLGPIVVGKWMDFVCHIKWSTTTTGALRECWRDGVLMGRKTSLNATDTNVHVLRTGQYQETNIGHTRTTYYSNVRIGTSYDAVDPSR
jgi:hypothetical protein